MDIITQYIGFFITIITTLGSFYALRKSLSKDVEKMEKRLDRMEDKFLQIDARFDRIEMRLSAIENRLTRLETLIEVGEYLEWRDTRRDGTK